MTEQPAPQKFDLDEHLALIQEARELCEQDAGGKPNSGRVECPKCGGQIKYTRFASGHIHGLCETEGCVRWME